MSCYKFTWSRKNICLRDFLCQHRCRSIRFPAATAQIVCGELAQRALLADWLLLVVTYLSVFFPEFVMLIDRL